MRRLEFTTLVIALMATACFTEERAGPRRDGELVAAIGSAGGELANARARVVIPPGALARSELISLAEVSRPLPAGNVGTAIALGPEGLRFARPVSIVFRFEAAALPDPERPELLAVAVLEDGAWVELADGAVDVARASVSGTTSHFSTFGVVQRCNEHHPCPEGQACVERRCVAGEVCSGEVDEDGDGAVDCRDLDCRDDAACECRAEGELLCCYPKCGADAQLECLGDNICGYPCSCVTPTPEDCANGVDDDHDGTVDCGDPDCAHSDHCSCTLVGDHTCCHPRCSEGELLHCSGDGICGEPCSCVPATHPELCDNRADDDGDMAVDCQDPDCHGSDLCDCHAEGELTCCYAKCHEGEVLECLGENICGYPCSCVRPCGECVSDHECAEGQRCSAHEECLVSCACPECDVCAGHCVPAGEARWYYTCGDPVCHGHSAGPEPACTTQVAGAACSDVGASCDPLDDCNRRLLCATADPTQQPGGCPISRRDAKLDVRYLDEVALRRVADEALAVRLATWRYTFAPERERLGFIIDDDPRSPAVDPVRDMVDLYGFTSMALAALQVQAREIEELRARLEALAQQCLAVP